MKPEIRRLEAGPVCLEPLCVDHALQMFEVLSDPAIYEFENEPPRSADWLHDYYKRLEARQSPEGDELWLNWAVRLPNGELAGFVQATVLQHRQAYVAYVLTSRFWRQGIAAAAVQAVLAELRCNYLVLDVFAVLKTANYRSVGLLQKLSFKSLPMGVVPPWPQEVDEVTMQLGALC